jgi:DtxR family Mn-dependent transcriptional regulator
VQVGETIENYLETIYMLTREKQPVRSVDIANEMGYSKPTISIMMRQLKESGYIRVGRSGYITLTDTGLAIAERVYERHILLTEILVSLGVDEKIALEDACKVEHNLSKESFECIKNYFENIRKEQGRLSNKAAPAL